MTEVEIKSGSKWASKKNPADQVSILGLGESVNGVPVVRFMGDSRRVLVVSQVDFLDRYEPRRRTVYEHLLDED
jgi:hypothetical protein